MGGDPHLNGEIWSGALRDLFLVIGKTKTDKLMLQGYFLIKMSPTFSDGLTALVDADEVLFSSADKKDICFAFQDRGIKSPRCE